MSDDVRRRTYRRLGVVTGALGLLLVATMLGLIGDEALSVGGLVLGLVAVVAGSWLVARSRRIGSRG